MFSAATTQHDSLEYKNLKFLMQECRRQLSRIVDITNVLSFLSFLQKSVFYPGIRFKIFIHKIIIYNYEVSSISRISFINFCLKTHP